MIILLVCEGATAPVASEPSGVRIVKFPGFVELPGPSQGSAVRRDCGKCFDELDHWILPSRSPQRAETALASRVRLLRCLSEYALFGRHSFAVRANAGSS